MSGTLAIAQENSAPIPLAFRPLRGVTIGETSYVIGDSEPIVGPSLHADPVFSPGGESLMVLTARRQDGSVLRDEYRNRSDDTDYSLVYWNAATHRARTLWTYAARSGESVDIEQGHWFPDSRHYCFSLTHSEDSNGGYDPIRRESVFVPGRRELVFVDAVHGGAKSVDLRADYLSPAAFSPTRNVLAIGVSSETGHQSTSSLCILDSSGDVLQTLPLASGEYIAPISSANWCSDEALNIVSTKTAQTENGLQTAVHLEQINVRTGKIIDQNSLDAVAPPAPPTIAPEYLQDLKLLTVSVPLSENDPATTSVYLATAQTEAGGKALISADAYGVRFVGTRHGSASGIVYFSHGTLLYAPLLKMTATEFNSEQKDRVRIETIARLQRIRYALRMYAAEKHGSPTGTSDLRHFLVGKDQPLQNDTDFRDPATGKIAFVYKFTGGLDPGLTYDQEVPIGYMAVEGGRFALTNRQVTFEPAADNVKSAKPPR